MSFLKTFFIIKIATIFDLLNNCDKQDNQVVMRQSSIPFCRYYDGPADLDLALLSMII